MNLHLIRKRAFWLTLCVALPFCFAVLISIKSSSAGHGGGCTSWAAIGNALDPAIRGRKVILHKSRDMADIHTMEIREIHTGTYKYLALAGHDKDNPNPTDDKIWVWAGVNEAGLATASNYVGGVNLFGTMGGGSFCREILENCNSVDSAYAFIASKKSNFYSGNLIFLADSAKIAVVEVKVGLFGSVQLSSKTDSIVDGSADRPAVMYRSNHYIKLSNYVPIPAADDTIARYNRLTGLISSTRGSLYGAINVDTSREVSRLEKSSGNDAICRTSTLARITIEIDTADPLESIIWFGPGYNESLPDGRHCSDDNGSLVSYTFSR